ncbi:hypothetical protein LTR48_000356 [Friedmanniomyces endolithicus]|uniref:Uncharacterized protein n=1 Tax=Rachicladosporium monterosium TaxID=1507873 RepID=A0ABR0LGY3_9PEZI|nr:hypothetical protein LTR48_000356 [Friedmanniomyces endolithicus]KAK5148553.1 hypothetical protein LTR32_000150 [Rachicladosporium monterosium]
MPGVVSNVVLRYNNLLGVWSFNCSPPGVSTKPKDHEGNPGRLGGTPIVGVSALCDDSQRLPRVPVPYKGVPKDKVDNVFRKACQLRSKDPTPDDITLATKTDLCYRTVSAILEAALRLAPVDRSPEGTLQRQQKAAERDADPKLTSQ